MVNMKETNIIEHTVIKATFIISLELVSLPSSVNCINILLGFGERRNSKISNEQNEVTFITARTVSQNLVDHRFLSSAHLVGRR